MHRSKRLLIQYGLYSKVIEDRIYRNIFVVANVIISSTNEVFGLITQSVTCIYIRIPKKNDIYEYLKPMHFRRDFPLLMTEIVDHSGKLWIQMKRRVKWLFSPIKHEYKTRINLFCLFCF